VLFVVALGEMPNHETIFLIKFHGLNCLFRWGLVRAFPKINFVHVLKSRQLRGLNKFSHSRQSCSGLQYLKFDTKIALIASVC
jgi:hypothetical protein